MQSSWEWQLGMATAPLLCHTLTVSPPTLQHLPQPALSLPRAPPPLSSLSSQDCGQEGKACCYSYDTSSEAQRCLPGLSCVATGILAYGSFEQYSALMKNPNRTADTRLMGTCM